MPASDEPSSPDVSCPTCKSPEFKPVLISERFGVETFFCPECEQTWEKLGRNNPRRSACPYFYGAARCSSTRIPAYASGVS